MEEKRITELLYRWSQAGLKTNIDLFLISGYMQSGKTTFANMLYNNARDEIGYNRLLITSYAKAVKDAAFRVYGWNGEKDDRGRKLLQDVGRIGRDYYEDIWAEKTLVNIQHDKHYPHEIIFIDDWRFPNEYLYLGKTGLFKITRFRMHRHDLPYNGDISEHSLDDSIFDYHIYNYGTLDDLNDIAYSIIINMEE